MNKYRAKITFSDLCNRWFDSKAEARRGEELYLLERAGEITDLMYQVKFLLCVKPKISIKIDFAYKIAGMPIYEDTKGILTRDSRTKLAWLKEKFEVEVILSK